MSLLKPNYSQKTRDALAKGKARGGRVMVGGGVARAIPKAFKIAGQKKAVKLINGWAVNGGKTLTNKVRGSWK